MEDSQVLAKELLDTLQKFPGKARKRDAVKSTFKMMWKENDIKILEERLEKYRKEITVHLLSLIR